MIAAFLGAVCWKKFGQAELGADLQMPEIRMTVIDESGLHARPAARFVQAASRFTSRIVIRNGEREADAKSLISLLGLAVRLSSEITVAAEGSDADEALASLAAELTPYVTQSGESS